MAVSEYLSRDRVVLLGGRSKPEVFVELAAALSEAVPDMNAQEVLSLVRNREETFSTRISDVIAVPHAIVKSLPKTVMALGISHGGILYDAKNDRKVRIIVMMLGSEVDHLKALREVVLLLQHEDVCRQLISASTAAEAYALISGPEPEPKAPPVPGAGRVTELTLHHAALFARQTGASKVLVHVDESIDLSGYSALLAQISPVFVIYGGSDSPLPLSFPFQQVTLPFRDLRRSSKVDVALLYLLSQGLIGRKDRIVSVLGDAGSGTLDSLTLTEVEREFSLFFSVESEQRPKDLEPQVLTRVLQLASTLALEGREGKPVGTFFVLGDYEAVKSRCQQLIINPFRGYPEEERNILDPSLEETVKEFSRIDGAFVIRGDGLIVSAGTFIKPGTSGSSLIAGLGARHAAAASITGVTLAVSVAVSESTRKVSLFRGGRRFLVV